jgi:hypothetical protein
MIEKALLPMRCRKIAFVRVFEIAFLKDFIQEDTDIDSGRSRQTDEYDPA